MDKRAAKREYLLTPRPMGVFQVRNLTNDKVFIGVSQNLDGIFNRIKFQLNAGSHKEKAMQDDWNKHGAYAFAFEVLETLELRDNMDVAKELEFLEDLWLDKLQPFGERGYNTPKMTRGQRLQMIAANRNKQYAAKVL